MIKRSILLIVNCSLFIRWLCDSVFKSDNVNGVNTYVKCTHNFTDRICLQFYQSTQRHIRVKSMSDMIIDHTQLNAIIKEWKCMLKEAERKEKALEYKTKMKELHASKASVSNPKSIE